MDDHPHYIAADPSATEDIRMSKQPRRAAGGIHGCDATPTTSINLFEIVNTSYWLSHPDVTHNDVLLNSCDNCHTAAQRSELRSCDGSFPSIIGSTWPEGAFGRQFQCRRGALCNGCDKALPKTQKYWLCNAWLNPSQTHEDLWGHNITEPPYLRHNRDHLWMFSTPNGTYPKVPP